MTVDVFISYARVDRDIAAKLVEHLKTHGVRIWIDTDRIDPLDHIGHSIRNAIDSTKITLCIISGSYLSSRACTMELLYAWHRTEDPGDRVVLLPIDKSGASTVRNMKVLSARLIPDLEGRDDIRFVQVSARLATLVAEMPPMHDLPRPRALTPICWPGYRKRDFVGRISDMWSLHERLVGPSESSAYQNSGPGIVNVVGPRGIGKTTFAIEYSHTFCASFPGGVYYAYASSVQSDIQADLLILDNADEDSETINKIIHSSKSKSIIILSTRPCNVPVSCTYILPPLPKDDSKRLLTLHSSPQDETEAESAESICGTVLGHPLALQILSYQLAIIGGPSPYAQIASQLTQTGSALRSSIYSEERLTWARRQTAGTLALLAPPERMALGLLSHIDEEKIKPSVVDCAAAVCDASVEAITKTGILIKERDSYSMSRFEASVLREEQQVSDALLAQFAAMVASLLPDPWESGYKWDFSWNRYCNFVLKSLENNNVSVKLRDFTIDVQFSFIESKHGYGRTSSPLLTDELKHQRSFELLKLNASSNSEGMATCLSSILAFLEPRTGRKHRHYVSESLFLSEMLLESGDIDKSINTFNDDIRQYVFDLPTLHPQRLHGQDLQARLALAVGDVQTASAAATSAILFAKIGTNVLGSKEYERLMFIQSTCALVNNRIEETWKLLREIALLEKSRGASRAGDVLERCKHGKDLEILIVCVVAASLNNADLMHRSMNAIKVVHYENWSKDLQESWDRASIAVFRYSNKINTSTKDNDVFVSETINLRPSALFLVISLVMIALFFSIQML